MTISTKTVDGKRLLYVMALDHEYGPHLKSRFTPLMTGVGPVEAAVAITAALCTLEAENALPDLVISLGSAGSARLEQTAVYQASSVAYRDMDASPLGFEKGETPFAGLPVTIDLGHAIRGLDQASLSTGANIVSGKAYDAIEADMVDMETFAILRACQRYQVPLIALRGISDGAGDLHHIDDWTQYLHVIDEKLAGAVDTLEASLGDANI
ncbi:5'-methylthioadenosine/S-adenosylhomocysteine nucleosidase [Cucumibacter marinus]|uniref:5'-methylthioadenosine/S-adenosylhomocysteine nucleosidase n=1 Tax=Cucumibacter marinus TaxID=1121252 RepID=UPI000409ED59|nr:5'-methylthioadenosine/S-adenosylhomocysteine nucleosidase [Cucumibacter marinus]